MTQADIRTGVLRKISSDTAEFHTAAPLAVALLVFGVVTVLMLLTGHYLVALGAAAVFALFLWGTQHASCRMAEEAYCAEDHFLLKVNGEEVVIPYKLVKCIYFQPGKPDTIGIGTKSVYPLGEDMQFVPEGGDRMFSAFSDHPLVAELKALVKAARPPAIVIGVDPNSGA